MPADPRPCRHAALPAADTPPLPPLLLTAAQAAVACAVSEATWYRWQAAGRCPAPVHIGPGVTRWRRQELEAWCAAGCPNRKAWEALQSAQHNGRPV